ncbi:hypothetical protein T439DRAFT_327769 [Meredithblackwellia eburnea MCA 4105]
MKSNCDAPVDFLSQLSPSPASSVPRAPEPEEELRPSAIYTFRNPFPVPPTPSPLPVPNPSTQVKLQSPSPAPPAEQSLPSPCPSPSDLEESWKDSDERPTISGDSLWDSPATGRQPRSTMWDEAVRFGRALMEVERVQEGEEDVIEV